MGKYVAYPAYKDSGIEWLGGVPEHWEVKRVRFVIRSNPVKSELNSFDVNDLVSFIPMENIGEYGGITLTNEKPLSDVYTGYTYFAESDVILAKITPCFENGKGALAKGLTNGIAFGTTELHVMRALTGYSEEFLFYLSISQSFREIGASEMFGAGGQKRVPEDFIKNFRTGFPDYNEQQQIANFLDDKTAHLDKLIGQKRQMIGLLNEKRMALITQAVTKGLDLAAPMKDSGVEWLGDVPQHWEMKRLKFVFVLQRGHDLSTDKMKGGEFPVCASNGVIGWHDEYTSTAPSVTVGRSGSVGEVNYIDQNFWAHNTALYIKQFFDCVPRYSYYLLLVLDLKSLSFGSAVGSLNRNYIHDLKIPIPNTIEQTKIVNEIAQQTQKIDAMIKTVKQAITTLQEYRTALITAAVTGKIDVRSFKLYEG